MSSKPDKVSWLERPIFSALPFFTCELCIFAIILILTTVSRLYNLGARVMSHDESLHVYYSWLFSNGFGYQHTPTTHGPLQFHLISLIFTLFGDNDFTARLPHALASILTVFMIWKWRRYLGRAGSLLTAGLLLLSPFMLYYGRYARNESFVALLGVMTLYAILRYLETGKHKYFLLLTVVTALHFVTKETAFIYTAQAMLFLAFCLIRRVSRSPWQKAGFQNVFVLLLVLSFLLLSLAIGVNKYTGIKSSEVDILNASPQIPGSSIPVTGLTPKISSVTSLFIFACIGLLIAAILLVIGYGWRNLRRERSFDMLVILGTFVLPLLTAIPVKALGWNPLDYSFTWPGWNLQALWSQGPFKTATILFLLIIISIVIGLLWDWKRWLKNAAAFWGIYIFLFSSVFSNWSGLATGTVGSLGYWLVQQGVNRGSQPWYYYLLIQLPLYEYLPALGLILAFYFGLRKSTPTPLNPNIPSNETVQNDTQLQAPIFPILAWWALSSLVAYSIAGEKMPWLTVHITLPMILLSGWALGIVVEQINWPKFTGKGLLTIILLILFLLSLSGMVISGSGATPPFQGKTLADLYATGIFLMYSIIAIGCGIGLVYIARFHHLLQPILRLAVLVMFSLLAVLTARTAVRAAFLHPNDASEYLVYAHGATGIKDVMSQIEMISNRIAGGKNINLAFDNSAPDSGVAWPFTWYVRNYPNKTTFDQPTSDLATSEVIIVDQKNFETIKSVVGDEYYVLYYMRMVWPNQDYFNLTWTRIKDSITNPSMRQALWNIWISRDYSLYSVITENSKLTESDWSPSDRMRLYIRKDAAAKIWDYGILQTASIQADPYEHGRQVIPAQLIFGQGGSDAGQLSSPHGIAIAPDGSLYVADTNNNRIQQFSADGQIIKEWGIFEDINVGEAPIGTFNQPWALALSPDGYFLYVADTWNHRIQKFTREGSPIKMWGTPLYDPTTTDPDVFWGPRGIAVDIHGRVFVSDTGNKRILVYDSDGNFIMQIGNEGLSAGQFEEPVGIAFDSHENLFVADTWNQRIQVFEPSQDGSSYSALRQWDVVGWYGESLENKPFLAIDQQDHVFATDPEAFRVLEFSNYGEFIRTWGEYGIGSENFGLASGIAADATGRVWVSDTANNRLMQFTLP